MGTALLESACRFWVAYFELLPTLAIATLPVFVLAITIGWLQARRNVKR